MTIVLNPPSITRRAYQQFLRDFNSRKFGNKRLGQAFYEHFKLEKLVNQTQFYNLQAKDGDHAIASINQIFKIK